MTYKTEELRRGHDIVKLVFSLTEGEGFIAGGFARYCLSTADEPVVPNDIDVFCENEETFERIAARFKKNPNTVRKSDSAIETKYEYRMSVGFHQDAYAIQLIKPAEIFNMVSAGDVVKILDNFDFTIAKCAILPDGSGLAYAEFQQHESDRVLVLTNIHCPISSMKRVVKYCQKGYSVNSAEMLKLFIDYENRSPDWKSLVREGLGTEDLATWPEEKRQLFVQTMYFD